MNQGKPGGNASGFGGFKGFGGKTGFGGGKFGMPSDKSKLVHGMFLIFGGLMLLKMIFGGAAR